MRCRFLLGLLVASLFAGTACASDAVDVDREQRQRFLAAYERLESRQPVDLDVERRALAGYPLTPYLEYRDLLNRIGRADAREVRGFLERHEDLPVTRLLTNRWLTSLARRERWDTFLDFDHGGGGSQMACYRLRAQRYAGGVDQAWLDAATELWTVGYSQPRACDPVFAELYERDALSADQRWARMERIMRADNPRLARALRSRLDADDRRWLDSWLELAQRPGDSLFGPGFDVTGSRGGTLAVDGFRRLARGDRDRALALLPRYREQGWLSEAQADGIERTIALRSAYSRERRAVSLLAALPESVVDETVREWRARLQVGRQDWAGVRQAIGDMDAAQQRQSEWRYWLGHALWELGDVDEAQSELDSLAGERHYYGFLAADLLGRPYSMNHEQAPVDREHMASIASRPGVQRAREWFRLGYAVEARREWHAALAEADPQDWSQAAQLARNWGWWDRTIDAANRAGLHDALELRFPLAFRENVKADARAVGVDPALVFALIRKESAFNPEARSHAGALGLMQVMPGTGREVAQRHGLRVPSGHDLLAPSANLRLGNLYLAEMLSRFEGNMILAGAAYNAGPNRAEGWKSDNAGLPAAVWIENITFGETRDYVKSLLAFRAVFDWHLRGEPRSLVAVMQPMPGGPHEELDIALREDD